MGDGLGDEVHGFIAAPICTAGGEECPIEDRKFVDLKHRPGHHQLFSLGIQRPAGQEIVEVNTQTAWPLHTARLRLRLRMAAGEHAVAEERQTFMGIRQLGEFTRRHVLDR
jgi:hypothetical protein